MSDTRSVSERLAEPFPASSLGWKPQSVKNNRALAVAYIDARDVMDRLDAVLGPENWQDEFLPLPDGQVVCRLSVRINGEWIVKSDVGGESEQPDADDRKKAAFSDALKRAAIHWGIGRYLYAMPSQWCDYDPVKKQFVQTPQIPTKFLPRAAGGKPAETQKSQTQTKPAEPSPEQTKSAAPMTPFERLKIESERIGWNWATWMQWLAAAYPGSNYNAKTVPKDVPAAHIEQMLKHARTLPQKAA